MIFIWSLSTFSGKLQDAQLKYTKGNIFEDTKATQLAKIGASVMGGFLYSKLGPQNTIL